MEPNYLVIGAPKAATTSLCSILAEHPEIYMFPPKETHFFDQHYDRGWAWYTALFKADESHKAVGEGTPSYTGPDSARIAERIAEHLPDARLIYMLRHPVDRLPSHYVQMLDNGQKLPEFNQALREHAPLMEVSRYWQRLSDFRRYFSDEQILVVFFEDFVADPSVVCRRCFKFLDVDADWKPTEWPSARNTRSDKRIDRPWMRWLRKQRWYLAMNWMTPRSLIQRLKPIARARLDARVEWEPATRAWALDELRDDAQAILEYAGRSPEIWPWR